MLAKIELVAQVSEHFVARKNGRQVRGRGEPACQARFAHRKPRAREQLEEAAAPEKVEVGGIDVLIIAEAIACFAGACPAIGDAVEASLVKRYGSVGAISIA